MLFDMDRAYREFGRSVRFAASQRDIDKQFLNTMYALTGEPEVRRGCHDYLDGKIRGSQLKSIIWKWWAGTIRNKLRFIGIDINSIPQAKQDEHFKKCVGSLVLFAKQNRI